MNTQILSLFLNKRIQRMIDSSLHDVPLRMTAIWHYKEVIVDGESTSHLFSRNSLLIVILNGNCHSERSEESIRTFKNTNEKR